MFWNKKAQNLKMFLDKKAQNLKIRCTIILVHNFVGHRFVYFWFFTYLCRQKRYLWKKHSFFEYQ